MTARTIGTRRPGAFEFGDIIHDKMADALKMARQLFGPTAVVSIELVARPADNDPNKGIITCRHCVGRRGHDAYAWQELGCGETWDAAFAAAQTTMKTRRG